MNHLKVEIESFNKSTDRLVIVNSYLQCRAVSEYLLKTGCSLKRVADNNYTCSYLLNYKIYILQRNVQYVVYIQE